VGTGTALHPRTSGSSSAETQELAGVQLDHAPQAGAVMVWGKQYSARRYVFDIETNGFLDQLDRVHCLVLKDIDTGRCSLSCHNHRESLGPETTVGARC
jgi:hypothetical protein